MMKIATILKYMYAEGNDDLLSPHVYFVFNLIIVHLTSIYLQETNLKNPVLKSRIFFVDDYWYMIYTNSDN